MLYRCDDSRYGGFRRFLDELQRRKGRRPLRSHGRQPHGLCLQEVGGCLGYRCHGKRTPYVFQEWKVRLRPKQGEGLRVQGWRLVQRLHRRQFFLENAWQLVFEGQLLF